MAKKPTKKPRSSSSVTFNARLASLLMVACRAFVSNRAVAPAAVQQHINVKSRIDAKAKMIVYNITVGVVAGSDVDPELLIECTFELLYECESKISEELSVASHDFGQMFGVIQIWPYWREYVQSTAGKMGLPPLLVPVMTIDELSKMNFSDESNSAEARIQSGSLAS